MEILIILLFAIINGVFAMAELAVVSSRKARLQQRLEDGDHRVEATLALIDSPNRFLSTVQIAITLIGTAAGVFGGTTIAGQLAVTLRTVPLLAPYADTLAVVAVVAVTTYFSLVLGELVPKRIAMRYPEQIALLMTRPMNLISTLTSPVVRLLSTSTDLILRLLRIDPLDGNQVTDAEVVAMMEEGVRTGIFARAEPNMVEGVLRLDEIRINAVMTARPDVVWLSIDAPESEIRAVLAEHAFSVYPVYQTTPDNPLGVVRARELLAMVLRGQPLDLHGVIRKAAYIPETAYAAQALEMFRTTGVHVGLVVDEYGGITGLLTLTDLLEEIVGHLDHDEPEVVRREDGSLLVDGVLSIHRLMEVLPGFALPEDEESSYSTLAGFIMMRLGRVPSLADHFRWQQWRFEVMDMDGNHIDQVLVTVDPVPKPLAESTSIRASSADATNRDTP